MAISSTHQSFQPVELSVAVVQSATYIDGVLSVLRGSSWSALRGTLSTCVVVQSVSGSARSLDACSSSPPTTESASWRSTKCTSSSNSLSHSIRTTCRALQPVATCRQSLYLHKPAIVIVTSFSWWCLAPTALAAPIPIMTSFSFWRHSLLSWPRPPLRTYVRYGHLTAFMY